MRFSSWFSVGLSILTWRCCRTASAGRSNTAAAAAAAFATAAPGDNNNSEKSSSGSRRLLPVRHASSSGPRPIDPSGWPRRFPAKDHCSRCGLCETSFVSKVTEACAFLGEGMARMDRLENTIHGRARETGDAVWSSDDQKQDGVVSGVADEARFGVLHQPVMLARGVGIEGAQWTGCVTGIALSMLESKMVDAVVCIANKPGGEWSSSEPILAKTPGDVLRGRGVKPALSPSLRVLDEIRDDPSVKKLLFCGVGCAVQAFRQVQNDLGLDDVYVLGTNCADNSPTPRAAEKFIRNGVKVESDDVKGYEFMQDFKVHVKTADDYVKKPYFVLPGSIAKQSIATSCLACFDYTNGLADVVVGYMGAPLKSNTRMDASPQTLTIRNQKGADMVRAAIDQSRLRIEEEARGSGSHEKLASATVASDSIVLEMTGKDIREEGMPRIMGEIMAFAMTNIGPKGTNFARYSIDYHILRNYFHVLDEWGEKRTETAIPKYAREIANHYFENDKAMADLRSELVRRRKKPRP